jgi:signal transduction histidine kinase
MQQQVEALGLSDPQAAIAMQQQLDLIRKMIERKLAAARVTGDMLPAAQMTVPKDFDSLLTTLTKVYRHKTIAFDIVNQSTLTRIPVHREDGMELFGNLLDNAFKWAESQITVTLTTPTTQQIWVTIEDDGAGVQPEQLTMLTARGTRLDEEVMGHGLGLSIVKEICEQYGFELQFTASQTMSGLAVTIVIPLSKPTL